EPGGRELLHHLCDGRRCEPESHRERGGGDGIRLPLGVGIDGLEVVLDNGFRRLHGASSVSALHAAPVKSRKRSTALSETRRTDATTPAAVVSHRFANVPRTLDLAVRITRGMRANGIPNDRTTWLRTRAAVGSNPIERMTSAGISEISRRVRRAMRTFRRPCMVSAPAYAPTEVDASPEASSPTAKSVATTGPMEVSRAAWAPSRLSVPGTPARLVAARSRMARFTLPAMIMAIDTSQRVTVRSRAVVSPAARTANRSRVSAECA